jgi:hypothetical protein
LGWLVGDVQAGEYGFSGAIEVHSGLNHPDRLLLPRKPGNAELDVPPSGYRNSSRNKKEDGEKKRNA